MSFSGYDNNHAILACSHIKSIQHVSSVALEFSGTRKLELNLIVYGFFPILTRGHFIDFDRGGGEMGIDVREKHWLVASRTHSNQGQNWKPRYMTLLGIKPATFWITLQPLKHTSQDHSL